MGQFVLAAWPGTREPSGVTGLRAQAEREGWRTLLLQPGLLVCGGGPRPPRVTTLHGGDMVVVGELFARAEVRAQEAAGVAHLDRFRQLSQTHWGRYVGLGLGRTGALETLFRDPAGGWDCVFWREGALLFATSSAPPWLVRPLNLSIDWRRMADILADPVLVSAAPPLTRVEALAPGEVRDLDAEERGPLVWTPAEAARAVETAPARAGARLRRSLDEVVIALGREASGVLVETSGGLDSAIVASSLLSGGRADRVVGYNLWGPYSEADERRYARSLADRLGLDLRLVERPEPLDAGALGLEHPRTFRPSLGRLDAVYDHGLAELCEALSLDTVLTGKGGDVALFQMATTAVMSDLLSRRGPLALVDPAGLVLARRLRRSLWAVLRRAVRVRGRRLWRKASPLVSAEVRNRRPVPHPWIHDLGGLPLGKRNQIAGFAHNLSFHGLSRRSEAADQFHPFLTQPVMEACLAAPTYVLSLGGHDRLLARRVFGDRLPDDIVRRRSKGELGAYFGHCIAAALEPLREHLLEGRLAAAGLLDREAVEASLHRDHLIASGDYGEVMVLAALESWTRAWS